jgi:cytochrome c oxidase subunit 4
MNSSPQPTFRQHVHRVLWTWLALIALMFASLGMAHLSLGAGNAAAGLVIAAAKSALVVVAFMSLGRAIALSRIAMVLALCMLALLVGLSAVDDATRDLQTAPMQMPKQIPPLLKKDKQAHS